MNEDQHCAQYGKERYRISDTAPYIYGGCGSVYVMVASPVLFPPDIPQRFRPQPVLELFEVEAFGVHMPVP